MRGFKIAHGKLGKQLRTARARVATEDEPVEVAPRGSNPLLTPLPGLDAAFAALPGDGVPANPWDEMAAE
jgi:hypothetical protein